MDRLSPVGGRTCVANLRIPCQSRVPSISHDDATDQTATSKRQVERYPRFLGVEMLLFRRLEGDDLMPTDAIIQELNAEIERLTRARDLLTGTDGRRGAVAPSEPRASPSQA